MDFPSKMQTYQLIIQNRELRRIKIGALGEFEFPVGYYVYTGSARQNMNARISRHLSHKKKLRWHIDYLLNSSEVEIINIFYFHDSECAINQQTTGKILIPRFGASDCQSGCGSHLKFWGNRIPERSELVDSLPLDLT